jgi:cysteine desulfurase
VEPSRVLRALGIEARRAAGAIRFGIGRFTTADEIDRAADLFVAAVKKLSGRNR